MRNVKVVFVALFESFFYNRVRDIEREQAKPIHREEEKDAEKEKRNQKI